MLTRLSRRQTNQVHSRRKGRRTRRANRLTRFEQLEQRLLLTVYTSSDVPKAIPDQDTVTSTLTVPDAVTPSGPVLPTLSIDDVQLAEGDSGTTAFVFTVTRGGDTSGTSSVDFATGDGAASSASDYAAASGTVQFLATETSQAITVLVNGDTTFESNETFTVTLSGEVGATISDGSGLGPERGRESFSGNDLQSTDVDGRKRLPTPSPFRCGQLVILSTMSEQDTETEELVRLASDGNKSAERRLMDRHRGRLRKMVAVHLDPRLVARVDPSDVVQETLMIAYGKLSGYLQQKPIPFYPWLRQIAWNRLVDLHRRHVQASKRSVTREEDWEMALSDHSANRLADQLMARGLSPSQGPCGKSFVVAFK